MQYRLTKYKGALMKYDDKLFAEALDSILEHLTDSLACLAVRQTDSASVKLDSCIEFFPMVIEWAQGRDVNLMIQHRKLLRIVELMKTATAGVSIQKRTWWEKTIEIIKNIVVSFLSTAGIPIPTTLLISQQTNYPRLK